MKRIEIVKSVNEIELAHLYEHIYLVEVIKFLKKNDLLNYIDYRWEGRTYQGGYIYIDLMLFSDRAIDLQLDLNKIKPKFSKRIIEGSLTEIMVEKETTIGGMKDLLIPGLAEVSNKQWSDLDDFGYLDAKAARRSRKILWLSDKKVKTKILRCEIILDKNFAQKNRHLLPLFTVLSDVLLDNLNNDVIEELHYYRSDSSSVYTVNKVSESVKFKLPASGTHTFGDVVAIFKESFENTKNKKMAQRLITLLVNNYSKTSYFRPDPLTIYEKCEVLIGRKGWVETATILNINQLLSHSEAQVSIGKSEESFNL